MSSMVTIAGALVDWVKGMIVTPTAAIIFGIILLGKIFCAIPVAAAPSMRGARHLREASPTADRPGLDQTPLAHTTCHLVQINHGDYRSPTAVAASSGRAPQRRQRRRPSVRAFAASAHGRLQR